jgi:hypothetical protein
MNKIKVHHFIEINGEKESLDMVTDEFINDLQDDLQGYIKKHPGGKLEMVHPITVIKK